MKNTDNIEKLFKETFENFEADVNPKVWTNVQSGINSGLGNAAGASAKLALGKIVAGAIAIAGIAGSVWYFDSNNNTPTNSSSNKNNQTKTVSKEVTQNIIAENKSEGNNSNTQTNKQTASPVHPSPNAVSNNQTQNASDVSGNETNSSGDNSDNSNSSSQPEHKYGNATQGDGGIMRYNKYNNNNTSAAKENSSSDETESTDESSANTNAETETEQHTVADTKSFSGISKVPNIFTPNGDGQNDFFVFEMKNIANIGVVIYSREIGTVYQWNTVDGSWNGKLMNGTDAPSGVYFYSIQAIGTDGVSHSENGSVTLSR